MFVRLAVIFALLASASNARADLFILTAGGQIEGELLNTDESPREKFVIRTAGGEVTLAKDQVKQVLRRSPEEIEFEQIRHQYPDTVEGQWALAQWCLDKKLLELRKQVLRRLIELDPEHAQARGALGYVRADGKWKTQDQARIDNGYVEYKGRWRTRQEVQMLQEKEAREQAEKGWFAKVRMWRGWMDGPKRSEAVKGFMELRDPAAIPALAQLLSTERNEQTKMLLVDTLYALDVPAADEMIAQGALGDPSDEIRQVCLGYLKKRPTPELVRQCVQRLKDKDNVVVNRAGEALGLMGDPSAITPLIDALITKHKYMISTGNPGSTTATFGSGGSGFSVGGGPKIIEQEMRNTAVFDALVMLSGGANYGYDVDSWKKWNASNHPVRGLDARRD